MSKPVKEMMIRDYIERIGETEDALVIGLRGISSNDTNAIRAGLAKKDIRVTIMRNSLFGKAFGETSLAPLEGVMNGASALTYGAESVVEVAREIVGLLKEFPDIELKGAILDGMLFTGENGVRELSKYPTRDEAIAQAVTLILSPARNLVGAVTGPGSGLVGIIKSIEEKLENGEAIAKL